MISDVEMIIEALSDALGYDFELKSMGQYKLKQSYEINRHGRHWGTLSIKKGQLAIFAVQYRGDSIWDLYNPNTSVEGIAQYIKSLHKVGRLDT